VQIPRGLVVLVIVCLGLAGCGQQPQPAQPEATIANESPPPASGTAPSGTAASTQLTLGDLASRVESAWPAIASYRATFTGATIIPLSISASPAPQPQATPGATPVARPRSTFVSTREVVLPDRQRQVVSGLDGDDHEAITIGEDLFIRGPIATRIAPGTSPTTWIRINLSSLPAGFALPPVLESLRELPRSPLASLPERLKPQVVRDLGTVDFDGRTCHVYGAADTVAATGMRIDYTIALDEQSIPCFIETGTGGEIQGRDEYTDINASLMIEAPLVATPVSGVVVPGSPAARD
jgi:hypothetical protein